MPCEFVDLVCNSSDSLTSLGLQWMLAIGICSPCYVGLQLLCSHLGVLCVWLVAVVVCCWLLFMVRCPKRMHIVRLLFPGDPG